MDRLARECTTFCRHLLGRRPSAYVLAKYQEFHRLPAARAVRPARAVDRALLAAARLHPAAALPADAFARIFRPGCALRKKLVLLLAILESSPQFAEQLDEVPSR